MTRSVQTVKDLPFFENVNMFTRFMNPYILVKFRLEKTIKTWHPFLHTLTSKTVSQIFGTYVCYFFTRGESLKTGKKTELPAKKGIIF